MVVQNNVCVCVYVFYPSQSNHHHSHPLRPIFLPTPRPLNYAHTHKERCQNLSAVFSYPVKRNIDDPWTRLRLLFHWTKLYLSNKRACTYALPYMCALCVYVFLNTKPFITWSMWSMIRTMNKQNKFFSAIYLGRKIRHYWLLPCKITSIFQAKIPFHVNAVAAVTSQHLSAPKISFTHCVQMLC